MPVTSTCQEETSASERFYVVNVLRRWHPGAFSRFWSSVERYRFASYDEALKYIKAHRSFWIEHPLILSQDELDMTIMAARAADALGLGLGEWGV